MERSQITFESNGENWNVSARLEELSVDRLQSILIALCGEHLPRLSFDSSKSVINPISVNTGDIPTIPDKSRNLDETDQGKKSGRTGKKGVILVCTNNDAGKVLRVNSISEAAFKTHVSWTTVKQCVVDGKERSGWRFTEKFEELSGE